MADSFLRPAYGRRQCGLINFLLLLWLGWRSAKTVVRQINSSNYGVLQPIEEEEEEITSFQPHQAD
jgi:hypothetical protein